VRSPPRADIIQPADWPQPSGYSNGVAASGRYVVLAGQIGWDPIRSAFGTDDFAEQTRQALSNIAALLREAGGGPQHLVRLTWYVTNRDEYVAARREIGSAYREIIGAHYPPMTVVVVGGLIEERAKVEIEATAVIPEEPRTRRPRPADRHPPPADR